MGSLLLLGAGSKGSGAGAPPPDPFQFVDDGVQSSSSTTHTFSTLTFGDEAVDRLMIVSICWADSVLNGTSEVTAVSIGGVGATRSARQGGDNQTHTAEIWHADVTTGTTGDVVVTNTGANINRITIALYRATGIASSTPTDPGTGTTNAAVDVEADDIVVACAVRTNGGAHTLDVVDLNYAETAGTLHYGFHGSHTATGTATLTLTISQTLNAPKIAIATWRPL